ncbi:Pycsar system effector family protein [Mucilaginibacter dorajii]|uniref:HD/PDEase domain-containing protein n=1 Tax=Mucilaginibacter dorajii TaxID=692994 RepID=A0ABP7QQE4_9SPHI|nr:Pycsar system effector family protein [Mucilaginibacter dorajii]MCS3733905.1 putative metal-dependent HD superfamily phosphohydrolase [Mucilaginibacter dorajii]
MKFQQLLEDVKHYVVSYFDAYQDPHLIYHDLKHTKDVVSAATKIANHYQLSDEDFFAVVAAAWFHDTGYFTDKAEHEAKSISLAEHELKQLKVSQQVIDKVKGCILATEMPQKPNGLLQEIICDADLFHLGSSDFQEKSKMVRKEFEIVKGITIDKDVWREKSIELLQGHQYFTDYCRLLLGDQQQKNLDKLIKKQEEVKDKKPLIEPLAGSTIITDDDDDDEVDTDDDDDTTVAEDIEKHSKSLRKKKPEKGIETMFRISSANHQRLSDMADNKAHIMITVNSIILSAIISLVLRKMDEHSQLLWPTFMLLTVSLLTITFSILATRPSIPMGVFTREDIANKTTNLLFFGNFYRMSYEDYSDGMLKMMDDSEFLYGSLIRDNYSQGVVLGKKYRLLRVSYNIFMFGLIAAVIAYIIFSVI